jgi:alpha-glucoside transport system substrate-binding protein
MQAGRLADSLIFEPGFVRGGTSTISQNWYNEQLDRMLTRSAGSRDVEPECWLYSQADFALQDLPPSQLGSAIDFFPLPPIDPNQPAPTVGHATFASAVVDTPEVRAFVEYVAGPEWGEIWAGAADAGFISPNRRFDASAYGDAERDPSVEVRTRLASGAQTALASGLFRFDASDLMPGRIGRATVGDGGDVVAGAFWQGMLDWVDGVRTIDQVLADIDAEWAALRPGGELASPDP